MDAWCTTMPLQSYVGIHCTWSVDHGGLDNSGPRVCQTVQVRVLSLYHVGGMELYVYQAPGRSLWLAQTMLDANFYVEQARCWPCNTILISPICSAVNSNISWNMMTSLNIALHVESFSRQHHSRYPRQETD